MTIAKYGLLNCVGFLAVTISQVPPCECSPGKMKEIYVYAEIVKKICRCKNYECINKSRKLLAVYTTLYGEWKPGTDERVFFQMLYDTRECCETGLVMRIDRKKGMTPDDMLKLISIRKKVWHMLELELRKQLKGVVSERKLGKLLPKPRKIGDRLSICPIGATRKAKRNEIICQKTNGVLHGRHLSQWQKGPFKFWKIKCYRSGKLLWRSKAPGLRKILKRCP